MKRILILLLLFSQTILLGQRILPFGYGFPFSYRIEADDIPDKVVVSYKENTAGEKVVPDSVKLVIVDSVYKRPSTYHDLKIVCPDTFLFVYLFDTNFIMIKYYPDFKIKLRRVGQGPNNFCEVKDTGKTHHISQVTLIEGRHDRDKRVVYSKFPLSRKKIRNIKEYVYNKGPEPMCIKRRNCEISAPEI